jgi:tetratricopeptide (TPR) repeat protein
MSDAINFYDALSLDRSDSTQTILSRIERIKAGQQSRAERPDAVGDAARAQLALIEQAERVFADDDARDAYDRSLAQAPAAPRQAVDWLARAWSYYWQRDFGAAEVAARKAREDDRDNPDVYVVSAWIELAPVTAHPLTSDKSWRPVWDSLEEDAKRLADEAYALDESSPDALHVRGACFYLLRDHARAVQTYRNALLAAPSPIETQELHLRIALAQEDAGDTERVRESCERAMTVAALPEATLAAERLWYRTVTADAERSPFAQRVDAYRNRLEQISASSANAQSKATLSQALEANIRRLNLLSEIQEESSRFRDRAQEMIQTPAPEPTGEPQALTVRELERYERRLNEVPAVKQPELPVLLPLSLVGIPLLSVIAWALIESGNSVGILFGLGALGLAIAAGALAFGLWDERKRRAGQRADAARYDAAKATLAALPTLTQDLRRLWRELESVSPVDDGRAYPPPCELRQAAPAPAGVGGGGDPVG